MRATTLLSHHLGLDAIAEGVETEAQLLCLQKLGCQYVQGYLVSQAMEAESTGKMIGRQMVPAHTFTRALAVM